MTKKSSLKLKNINLKYARPTPSAARKVSPHELEAINKAKKQANAVNAARAQQAATAAVMSNRKKLLLARKRTSKLTNSYAARRDMDIEESTGGVPDTPNEYFPMYDEKVLSEVSVSPKRGTVTKKVIGKFIKRTGKKAYQKRNFMMKKKKVGGGGGTVSSIPTDNDIPQDWQGGAAFVQAWRNANPWADERDVNYVFAEARTPAGLGNMDTERLRQLAMRGREQYYSNEGVTPKQKVDNSELLKEAYQQIVQMLNQASRNGNNNFRLVNGNRGELGIVTNNGRLVTNLRTLKKQFRGGDEYYNPSWDFYRSVLDMYKARRRMLRFKRRGYNPRMMRLRSHRQAAKRAIKLTMNLKNPNYYNERINRLERQAAGIQKGAQALQQRVINNKEALDQLAQLPLS